MIPGLQLTNVRDINKTIRKILLAGTLKGVYLVPSQKHLYPKRIMQARTKSGNLQVQTAERGEWVNVFPPSKVEVR